MTKRRPDPPHGVMTVLNQVPAVWWIGLIAAGAVFYGVTTYQLQDYKSDKEKTSSRIEEERREREKVRDAFIQNSNKTTELLGQMNARLAVGEATQKVQSETLKQIYDEMRLLNSNKKR